ncbi:MAG: GDSL-type esterase/lipase family protein [Actinomycetota bacterium]|nr:GDSL-type esterase/lipase family protein [Actinomycetota bacterium]
MFASICLFGSCSSSDTSFEISFKEQSYSTIPHTSLKEKDISTTLNFSNERVEVPANSTSSIIQDPEEVATVSSSTLSTIKKEEITETTLLASKPQEEEAYEFENTEVSGEIIRTPTKDNPLRVTTIGDSVAFDADLGIKAALDATEVVDVHNRSFGGVGLTQNEFADYLEESLVSTPEVVTVMVGGWDLAFAAEDEQKYSEIVESYMDRILEVASLVILIGMPPTPEREGLEENRSRVNKIYEEVSDLKTEIRFINTNEVLGGQDGKFIRYLRTLDGQIHQIRKVRDGKDDGHLCPHGAALVGESVFREINKSFPLVYKSETWWSQDWINDQRYDDPAGGCDYISET